MVRFLERIFAILVTVTLVLCAVSAAAHWLVPLLPVRVLSVAPAADHCWDLRRDVLRGWACRACMAVAARAPPRRRAAAR